jgi:hypothetical protein
VVREHGDLDAEDGRRDGGAEQALVALVVGVRDEGDARGEELGARGVDDDVVAVRAVEREAVVGARLLAVLELGLRDRGAEGDVPEGRRVGLVRLAAGEVAEERALRGDLRLG